MLFKKVKNDNKGSDVAFLGVAMIVFVVMIIGSIFDFWLLTYAKERVINEVELMELSSISKNFDYTDAAYRQNSELFLLQNCQSFIIKDFKNYFNSTFHSGGKSLFKSIELLQEPIIYMSNDKVVFDSGQIVFSLRRMMPITSGQTPMFASGSNSLKPKDEYVYSRVQTCIKVLFS